MKRIGELYDEICSEDNIYKAYLKSRKRKGRSPGVIKFEGSLKENISSIREELENGTYKVSGYETFIINDPKEREIYRLPFRDRVVQHAIANILGKVWNTLFIAQTYSCIKGRGIHGAVKHIKRDLKDVEGTEYCLKMDIRKYYPSIDHDVLKGVIRKKLKDERVLKLLDGIIDSAPGIPIGNYLSQFFANLYLTYFDHWLKEEKRVKYYYRYADDMVILSDDKRVLHELINDIRNYLRDKLKLELKDNWQIFPVGKRGIDFVGYVFYHDHVKMRKTIKKNMCRKASILKKNNIKGKEYRCAMASWKGWAKHCDSRNLIKKIYDEKVL